MSPIVTFFEENVLPQLTANFEGLGGFLSEIFDVIAGFFKGIDWEGIFGSIFTKA